jgi:hypothetical protein
VNIGIIGPSGVRALPLAAGIKEGVHYFRYNIPLVVGLLTPAIQNQRRGCHRVSNFAWIFSFFLKILEGGQLDF